MHGFEYSGLYIIPIEIVHPHLSSFNFLVEALGDRTSNAPANVSERPDLAGCAKIAEMGTR